MGLVSTLGNPVPEGAITGTLKTQDGVLLRHARWAAERRSNGTVCLLQGRAEFIEKYFEVVRELKNRGFAVVTFDWRVAGLIGAGACGPAEGIRGEFSPVRYRSGDRHHGSLAAILRSAVHRFGAFNGRRDSAALRCGRTPSFRSHDTYGAHDRTAVHWFISIGSRGFSRDARLRSRHFVHSWRPQDDYGREALCRQPTHLRSGALCPQRRNPRG